MISIVEGPELVDADSPGLAVLFMMNTGIRQDEVPGYRKRAPFEDRLEVGGDGVARER